MKAYLPHPYTVTFLEAGKQKPSTTTRLNYVSGEVPEISSDEVTTVAVWTNVDGSRSRCVTWQGALYLPVVSGGRHLEGLPEGPEKGQCRRAFPTIDHGIAIMGRRSLTRREEVVLFEAIEGSRNQDSGAFFGIVETNLERNRAITLESLNGLLAIDGAIWKKVPRAMIRLEPAPWDGGFLVTVVSEETGFDSVPREIEAPFHETELRYRHFALSEADRVRAIVGGSETFYRHRDIAALSEEPDPVDSERDYLSRTLRYALHRTFDKIGMMDAGAIAHWTEMRDAYNAHTFDAAPLSVEVAESLRAFVPHIDDQRVRKNLEEALGIIQDYERVRASAAMVAQVDARFVPR